MLGSEPKARSRRSVVNSEKNAVPPKCETCGADPGFGDSVAGPAECSAIFGHGQGAVSREDGFPQPTHWTPQNGCRLNAGLAGI